jgi:hypothetical protein
MVNVTGFAKEVVKGILIGVLSDGIIIATSFGFNQLGILNIANIQIPIWVFVLLITVLIPVVFMASRARRHSDRSFDSVRMRPSKIIRELEYGRFNVKWRVLYGSMLTFSEPYVFVEPYPYCPDCTYKMEAEKKGMVFKRYFWKCDHCGKFYRCPDNNQYVYDVVERLVDSDIRSGRVNLD